MAAALVSGLIQAKWRRCAARQERIAHRVDPLTGTSEFPDIAEAPVSWLDVAPLPPPPMQKAAITFAPLAPIRLAEPFEHLRDQSDRILAATGTRPKVFLACLGEPSAFTARATFAKNFFEAGGIEAVTNEGFADIETMANAFKASGAALACLCSSDDVYAQTAAKAATALHQAGARHIYLAGRRRKCQPACVLIHVGCDVQETIAAAYRVLGA